jgi:hypothetical protein
MALRKAGAAAAEEPGFNLGDSEVYVGSGGIPEGDYILKDFKVEYNQGINRETGQAKGPQRIGVNLTVVPLHDPNNPDEEKTSFYGFGKSAMKNFAPHPTNQYKVVQTPSATGGTIHPSCKWGMFYKSLMDSGLPKGVFVNDLSVLKGTWVHMQPTEAKDWKTIRAQVATTGEADEDEGGGGNDFVTVVSEIKQGGMPWEGGGGIPEEGATPKKGLLAKKPPAPAAAKGLKKTPPPPPPPSDDDDPGEDAARAIVHTILEANMTGLPSLSLRNKFIKIAGEKYEDDVAAAALALFDVPENRAALLAEHGFAIEAKTAMVKPA